MYDNRCPDCGAYLDPCERCDCAEKAAPGVATTEDGKGNKSNYIISVFWRSVNGQ